MIQEAIHELTITHILSIEIDSSLLVKYTKEEIQSRMISADPTIEESYLNKSLNLVKNNLKVSFLWPYQSIRLKKWGGTIFCMNTIVITLLIVSMYLKTLNQHGAWKKLKQIDIIPIELA